MKTAEKDDDSVLRYGLFGKLDFYKVNETSYAKINKLASDVSDEMTRIG